MNVRVNPCHALASLSAIFLNLVTPGTWGGFLVIIEDNRRDTQSVNFQPVTCNQLRRCRGWRAQARQLGRRWFARRLR
jgi:hypothetical protein